MRSLIYISIIAFIMFLLYTMFTKSKHKNNNINLPHNNIFCKDKTIKEFAKDKVCQSLIDDYCQCYYNANCNIAYNVENKLINLAQYNNKYYLHILQQKEDKSINVIFELDLKFYIKSIKCITQ
ncbi:MAG: hypothetical protein QXW35_05470 [Candidatus Aenigmatarchaeota archaeon]